MDNSKRFKWFIHLHFLWFRQSTLTASAWSRTLVLPLKKQTRNFHVWHFALYKGKARIFDWTIEIYYFDEVFRRNKLNNWRERLLLIDSFIFVLFVIVVVELFFFCHFSELYHSLYVNKLLFIIHISFVM